MFQFCSTAYHHRTGLTRQKLQNAVDDSQLGDIPRYRLPLGLITFQLLLLWFL